MAILLMFLMILIIFSALSKYKQEITGQAGNNGTKDVQIMVPSKYLSNFSTLAMPLINCQINIF